METALSEMEAENARLTQDLQQKNNQNSDLQKSLSSQASQFSLEIKHLRENNDRLENELRDKTNKLQSQERKIERLEAELASKRSQGE
jgi:chromosome segregation ATPase